jgi:hypothetical protein
MHDNNVLPEIKRKSTCKVKYLGDVNKMSKSFGTSKAVSYNIIVKEFSSGRYYSNGLVLPAWKKSGRVSD